MTPEEHALWVDGGRSKIEYLTPIPMVEFVKIPYADGGGKYCSSCGINSEKRSDDDLSVIKFHHSKDPLGMLRTYCNDYHLPRWERTQHGESTVASTISHYGSSRKPKVRVSVEVELPPCGLEFLHSRGLCGCGEEE